MAEDTPKEKPAVVLDVSMGKEEKSEALDALIWFLDPDHVQAKRAYSELFRSLVLFFRGQLPESSAQDLAAEVMLKLTDYLHRELPQGKPGHPGKSPRESQQSLSPQAYQKSREHIRFLAFRFARRVLAETMRGRLAMRRGEGREPQLPLASVLLEVLPHTSVTHVEQGVERARFNRLLEKLTSKDRNLILAYYDRNDGSRNMPFAQFVKEHGFVSANDLRNRVGAIQRELREELGIKASTSKAAQSRRSRKSSVLPSLKSARASAEAQFTAYFPRAVQQSNWSTLLTYMHLKAALPLVEADSKRRFNPAEGEIASKRAQKNVKIARGTQILVVPQSDSIEFNPPQAEFIWQEDFHAAEFRFKPHKVAKVAAGKPLPIRVGFYVSPVLAAEIDFAVTLGGKSTRPANPVSTTTEPYQKVFVSYSHDDSSLASRLEKAYKALGIDYLRDVSVLRSGEEWNAAILAWIDKSEIFQLLWSEAARDSKYVRQEWKHALKLRRKQFIRPVFWQTPLPKPPQQLSKLHFTYMDF